MNKSRWISPLLAVLMCGAASNSMAVEINDSELNNCRRINDRITRLQCFDTLFKTPVEVMFPKVEDKVVDVKPEILHTPISDPIEALAREVVGSVIVPQGHTETIGNTTFDPWVIRYRTWGSDELVGTRPYGQQRASLANTNAVIDQVSTNVETSDKYDVYLATPEVTLLDETPPEHPAILYLTCQNDITTLHLILRTPLDVERARVRIASSNGTKERNFLWRNIENNKVYIAGRGLESIGIMREFVGHDNLDIFIDGSRQSQFYRFNIKNFALYMKALRVACHW